jgi:hypothetical protein
VLKDAIKPLNWNHSRPSVPLRERPIYLKEKNRKRDIVIHSNQCRFGYMSIGVSSPPRNTKSRRNALFWREIVNIAEKHMPK